MRGFDLPAFGRVYLEEFSVLDADPEEVRKQLAIEIIKQKLFKFPKKPLVSWEYVTLDMGKNTKINLTNAIKFILSSLKEYGCSCFEGECVPVKNCMSDSGCVSDGSEAIYGPKTILRNKSLPSPIVYRSMPRKKYPSYVRKNIQNRGRSC